MASIRFENITFHYGDKCILKDFSLDIEESQIMCLVGPSGCGKTTLIRCLCGFIKPETGSIYIGDRCVFSAEKRINIAPERRNVGVVFQDYAVWPHLTVWENVVYPMKKHHVPKDEIEKRAAHALAQVRMTGYEKHLPSQLSGGQQQRVAIARALVSSDDVIILDEPITNLDAKLREEMLVEIRQIQKEIGTTIIYITHDQEAALQLCDKMAIMDASGELCQVGTDEEIILSPANRFVFEFIGVSNFIPLKKESSGIFLDVGEKVPLPVPAPEGMDWSKGIEMGIRPMDIGFDPSSPIRGRVERAVFLGSEYDYKILLGTKELRVQRNTLDTIQGGSCQAGDEVGLSFLKYQYYYKKGEAGA